MSDKGVAATIETGRAVAVVEREASRSVVRERPPHLSWLDVAEADLVPMLRSSLYPGAADASIRNVVAYCKAGGLNIMLKPVHIVPMYVRGKDGQGDGMRDVIMPSINHYRTQASRSGVYMGMSLPEWGPMVEYTLDGVKVTVPEWCRITVRKLVQQQVVDFPAEEYWIENYATAGKDKKAPNAMWGQRSRGQLAKVTEAQALRKAFPEFTGAETVEEMEGKVIDTGRIDDTTGGIKQAGAGAAKQLDTFAGVKDDAKVGGEQALAGKPKADAKPKPEVKDKVPEDTGEVPSMPGEASNPWETEGKFMPGWKWLNEVMPTLGPKSRQAVADEHAALLWAVNDRSPAYAKTAGEFLKSMGVTPPERPDGK